MTFKIDLLLLATFMASDFENQLDAAASVSPSDLPLAHVTSFETSLRILGAGEFRAPKACPVYKERLLYTFVARPAYRFQDKADPALGVAFAPVCFLLDASCSAAAIRALPFDSGGFGRYKAEMHPSWELADFEMSDAALRTAQVIETFWPDSACYYEAKPRSGMTFAATKTLLQQYYTLITNGIPHGFDSRCCTIEVQLPSPTRLSGNLVAIFAPDRAADDPDYASLVASHGGHLIPYRFHEPFYPNDYFTSLYDAVAGFLEADGKL